MCIRDRSNFNKSAKIILTFLAVLLAGSVFRSCASESKLDQWRTDFEDFRNTAQSDATALSDSLRAITDSAIAVAEHASIEANELTDRLGNRDSIIQAIQSRREEFEVKNDSTFNELTEGQNVDDVVAQEHPTAEPWIRLTFSLISEVDMLREQVDLFEYQTFLFEQRDVARQTEIRSLRAGLTFQTARGDSLEVIVFNIPGPPPKERFLLIPLPSRKTSFLAGGIVGTVVYIFLDKFIRDN